MKRFFIHLAFNGTNYHGWQLQENAHTIQAELAEKISLLLKTKINIVGCGRTDTGVHAREFYAHFEIENTTFSLSDLVYKLNRFLPSDIVIYRIFEVDKNLHARFSALSRTYKYYISKSKNPFDHEFSYFFQGKLDVVLMQSAADILLEYNDFTSFSKLFSGTANNICKINKADWNDEPYYLVFTITADRFLRNMVRAIVGTLIEVGKGRLKPEDIRMIIESKNRSAAGTSVPPNGLFLEKVEYPF